MAEIPFVKMHGLGNDFVVLDESDLAAGFPGPDAARAIADRRCGIGCDQLLIVGAAGSGGSFPYRIFNADGSEAGQCGNGARCAFEYLRQRGRCRDRCRLQTAAGAIDVVAGKRGPRAMLGEPQFVPADIPLAVPEAGDSYEVCWQDRSWRFAALGLGNPHAVFEVDDVGQAPVAGLGEFLNRSSMFPERVNVGFVERVGRDRVRLRVYERGAGETPACGSAAAAAAVALGDSAAAIEFAVQMDGGVLQAGWDGAGTPAWIEGPASESFRGSFDTGRLGAPESGRS